MGKVDGIDLVCGCPTRETVIWPYDVWMHLEPCGVGDVHLDNGDYSYDKMFKASSLDELEEKTRAWVLQQIGGG